MAQDRAVGGGLHGVATVVEPGHVGAIGQRVVHVTVGGEEVAVAIDGLVVGVGVGEDIGLVAILGHGDLVGPAGVDGHVMDGAVAVAIDDVAHDLVLDFLGLPDCVQRHAMAWHDEVATRGDVVGHLVRARGQPGPRGRRIHRRLTGEQRIAVGRIAQGGHVGGPALELVALAHQIVSARQVHPHAIGHARVGEVVVGHLRARGPGAGRVRAVT